MSDKYKDLTDVRMANQSRNSTAIIGVCIMNVILALAYLMEVVKGTRTLGAYAFIFVWTIIPSVLAIMTYMKKKDAVSIRYIVSIGFAVLYSYIRFTTTVSLSFCYVIVIFVLLTVYADMRLSLGLGGYAVLVNIAAVIYKAVTVGLSAQDIAETEIIMACLVLSGAFVLMAISKISKINHANIIKAEKERKQSEKLLNTILKVADETANGVDRATGKTEHLKKSIEMTKGAMEELAGGASDAATAILVQQKKTEEISDQICEVGNITASIVENVNEAENKLESGQQAMDDLVHQVSVSESASKQVVKEMDELRSDAAKMQDIMALISNVASQTGLLALNASIEAARAGEAGRGFAVVASEISNLAGQTSTATGDINTLIDNISRSLNEVTEAVGELLKSNEMQNGYVSNVAEDFEKIHTNTQGIFEQVSRLQQMVGAVEESNRAIIESIENVSAVTQEVTAGANETLDISISNLESVADITDIMNGLSLNAEELRVAKAE